MRIQILSDLHIEFRGNTIPALAPGADVVILAGDLAPAHTRAIKNVAKRWKRAPAILYVPGNHEYYGNDIESARIALSKQCQRAGVTLLDPGTVTFGQVRFIGATLWTDFLLGGIADEVRAHREVGQRLSDFNGAIRHAEADGGLFTTRASARRHAHERAFIEEALERAKRERLKAVVVTHHAPSPRCIHPRFKGSWANPGFASDLEPVIARYQPPLWVHGHMHDRVDERLGDTRVLCNPQGYNRIEGHAFDPAFVVDI